MSEQIQPELIDCASEIGVAPEIEVALKRAAEAKRAERGNRYTLWIDEGLPVVRGGVDGRGKIVLRGSSLTAGTPAENERYIQGALGITYPIIDGHGGMGLTCMASVSGDDQ